MVVVGIMVVQATTTIRRRMAAALFCLVGAAVRPEIGDGEVAFRVPQVRTLFFTNLFSEVFEAAGLGGITFKQVREVRTP